MRIYFLSQRTAGLKLDGAYMGVIDGFEKFIDAEVNKKILAEVFPDGDFAPVSFFIDGDFFADPPEFADVYLTDGDAVIYLSRFEPRAKKLQVLAQARLNGLLATLFLNGGAYLSCESKTCNLYPLPPGFENAKLAANRLGGRDVLTVECAGALAVFSDDGRQIFFNPVESWDMGDRLTVTVNFATCAACKATCVFAYDGEKMTLESSLTREYAAVSDEILHFAFFESVLTRGDFAKYLSDGIKQNAAALRGYLGEFCDVCIPYQKFFERHGDVRAAGLVYPVKRNLFEIKYFAVDVSDGKIDNVYPVR